MTHTRITAVALAVLLLITSWQLLNRGPIDINILDTLLQRNDTTTGMRFILFEVRLPPVAAALAAGAALGVAGALFQQQVQNPLASPDVLGVTSGAAAAVLFASTHHLPVPTAAAALIGGLAAAALVLGIGWRDGSRRGRFLITGLAVGYLGTGLTSYILTQADINELATAYAWLVGSTRLATSESALLLLVILAVGGVLLVALRRPLLAVELGAPVATGLGFTGRRWNLVFLAISMVFAASATAVVGPLGFIGLLAPPIARRLGFRGGWWLTAAAAVGSAIVAMSDVVLATLSPERQLPTGLLTGLLGALFLAWSIGTRSEKTHV